MLRQLKNILRRHFGFSKNEIRGFYVLIPLTALLLYFPAYLKKSLKNQEIDYSKDKEILEDWYAESKVLLESEELESDIKSIESFDPNKLSVKQWMELGISEKVANRIVNYRLNDGRFNNPEDLLKIYDIDQTLIASYFDYMVIPSPKVKPQSKRAYTPRRYEEKEFKKFDLNAADITTFQTIKGIGPYWSKRLVRFREALGGFIEQNQVYELYGVDSSLASHVIESTYLEMPQVSKINVNTDSVKALSQHPYISYKTAGAIVKYRRNHGDYSDISELRKIVLISDSLYRKIEPYLTAE